MPCNEWNEQWVAKLYGELDPEEDRLLTGHLESCEECRDALDELSEGDPSGFSSVPRRRESLGTVNSFSPLGRRSG